MNLDEVEVAIIGAGPSGLIAARETSRKGLKIAVFEEHGEVGLPCHCAGLLSINGLESIGVPSSGVHVLNKIRGAHFYSPSNISFTVEWKKPMACVVDRHIFDRLLAEQAYKSGSSIRLKSKVNCVRRDGDKWFLEIGNEYRLRARLIIDAEGALPKIPHSVGIKTHEIEKLLKATQADILTSNLDPEYVEVYLSRNLAPKFFAWVIPLNDEVTRVGLACSASDVRNRLLKFIKKRFNISFQDKSKFLKYYAGLIITCGPIKRTYGDGLLIVGDSAGHTKPITGGGVIFGGICARIAGRVASKAIINNNTKVSFLKAYEKEWVSNIGKELRIALLVRKILDNLSDKDMDKIFSIAVREKVYKEIMSEVPEIDYQAITLIKVLRGKILKLTPILPIFLRALIRSLVG
ncbi:MAG: NAD(P)/FAD-dependent oxidoreductase [Candidatus Bathyarchaeia archaeon]